jgi:hypothetical protein
MHTLDRFTKKYRLACTLSYGDIYGQVVVWLGVIFLSLAVSIALMGSQPFIAFALVGLILVVSLPFLLFAFVTTLFNHIEVIQLDGADTQAQRQASYSRSEP